MRGHVAGAEKAQFLAGESRKQDAAFLFWLCREVAGQFEDCGGATGVVVCARMNFASLAGGHRELPSDADVIVMRANDDVLVRKTRKKSRDIVGGLHDTIHFNVHFDGLRCREEEALRLHGGVDCRDDSGQRVA